MTENKEHKHADLLRAVAAGCQIEANFGSKVAEQTWQEVSLNVIVENDFHIGEWRIKPEPKPDVIKYMFVEVNPILQNAYDPWNLRLTFDGETHKLKQAEVLNAEK